MTDADVEQRNHMLKESVQRLQEHFDTVQVIATAMSLDGERDTYCFARGHGNMYGRVESLREFVSKFEERVKISVRGEGDT